MSNENKTQEVVAEEKKVPNYKGNIKAISDLETEGVFPAHLTENEVPAFKTKFAGNQGGFKLPKLMVVTGIEKHGENSKYLSYLTYSGAAREFKANKKIVPADFKVKQLSGKQAGVMLDKYKSHKISTMFSGLHFGGTIGSDPEMFVEDKDGKLIPAFEFLGSQKDPKHFSKKHSFGNQPIYWDGFQAEFNTHPETCLGWNSDSTQYSLEALLNAARSKFPGAKLSIKNTVDIPYELLQSSAEEHVNFGCMPSLNIYGLKGKTPSARELSFRPAGGHIHFGIRTLDESKIPSIIKALDAILGVACVSLFANYDNPIRREYYGLPGEYRLPKHGIEYRTLSNAWLAHPFILNLVLDFGRKALCFGRDGFLENWSGNEKETIETIANCDVTKAREILARNKDIVMGLLKSSYKHSDITPLFNGIMNGMESMVKDPTDIENNWRLNGINGGWINHCNAKGCNVVNGLALLAKGEKV